MIVVPVYNLILAPGASIYMSLDQVKRSATDKNITAGERIVLIVAKENININDLDENSFWSHMKNRQRINELQEETAKYNAEFRRDQARIRELDRNPKAMEKIARERFFMKADDEDIFVLSDDDREIKGVVGDETAE